MGNNWAAFSRHMATPILFLVLGSFIGAVPLYVTGRQLESELEATKVELEEMTQLERAASDAWTECSRDLSAKLEDHQDVAFERMVRTQVEKVFWPCGRPELPACDGPDPKDLLDPANFHLHPDKCSKDCKYCAMERLVDER